MGDADIYANSPQRDESTRGRDTRPHVDNAERLTNRGLSANGDHTRPTASSTTTPLGTKQPGDNVEDSTAVPVVISNRVRPTNRFRAQLLHTAFVMASYFALGLMPSQTGVSFLDLIYLVGSDIETGSLIFTLGSLGYMIGSVVGGFLYDTVNRDLIFGACAFMSGALTLVVPWCPSLPVMVFTCSVRSVFTGAMNSGGTLILLKIWGKAVNPYMQALHFMFALGGMCSSLITGPFLMPLPSENATVTERVPTNTSATFLEITATFNMNVSSDTMPAQKTKLDSRVYIPHIIVGVFTILTCLPFVVRFLSRIEGGLRQTPSPDQAQEEGAGGQKPTASPCLFRTVRCFSLHPGYFAMFAVFFFCYGCTEEVYAAFLMPFVVKHLHWSKSFGAGANSVHWGSFAGGRFMGIFVAKILSVSDMIITDYVAILLGLLGLMVGAAGSDEMIWVSDAVVGAAMGSVFASSVTWFDGNLTAVSGKVAGIIAVCMAAGTISNTALLGYLFEKQSRMWFVYLTLGNTLLSFVLFVFMFINSRHVPLSWPDGGLSRLRWIEWPKTGI